MKKLWMVVAGAALVCAGCPVAEMAGTPEWTTYGKIKADFALNSNGAAQPENGDYVLYIDNDDWDGAFAMTAEDTRFGAKLEMGAVKGCVEGDFHGDDDTGGLAGDVLLRHAYVTLDLGNDMTLLAGQTDDVFSPLNPDVLNYTVGWNAGNVGYRRPQFRWEWAPESGLIEGVQAALSDPQTRLIGFPNIQARVGFRLSENLLLGGSIVTGKMNVGGAASAEEDIFGLSVDVKAKLGEKLAIVGEWFTGHNLGAVGNTPGYMGNIGYNLGDGDEIGCDGLWAAVVLKPIDKLTVNAGLMFETNDDDDIAAGDRSDNSCIFGNAIWHLNENTDAGIEVSKWETELANGDSQDNLRIQGSVIVRF